ncbi:helix-turn-helix domain-containing protein [Gilliamella intestini]|uniref:Helix-turn-helix n=1 Tax=Gilliamella intestini TaxID=1798183 RepID=A0A1C4DB95_9GAMM|nr:helix-turn-helix domain-containing protein [Gilliamella intestini]SCC28632.1 Helix-turn-helix [Gilliamella intestini]
MASYFWTILHNEAEYQKAMDRFTELFGKELTPLSEESDEFELLAMLIEKYENLNYPVEAPSPIDYIKFIMDQKGLTNEDMKKYLGSSSKVSEVLNGKRNLSLNMIKKLHNELCIPADILIQDVNMIDEENTHKTKWFNDYFAKDYGVDDVNISQRDYLLGSYHASRESMIKYNLSNNYRELPQQNDTIQIH